jgi:hypothetical protein
MDVEAAPDPNVPVVAGVTQVASTAEAARPDNSDDVSRHPCDQPSLTDSYVSGATSVMMEAALLSVTAVELQHASAVSHPSPKH